MRFFAAVFFTISIGTSAVALAQDAQPPTSQASATTPQVLPGETAASVNSESVQQLLAKGKVLVAVSGETGSVAFWFKNGTITYQNQDGSTNKSMSAIADKVTMDAGLHDRSEPRYRLAELYAGSPDGVTLPIENVTGGALSMHHLASIPLGAQRVVLIQAYDWDTRTTIPTQQIMALSFDAKVSLNTLRRSAVKEGAALVFRIKDLDAVERSHGVYIAGRIPNTPFDVTTGIVDSVAKEDLHGRDSGVANNVAPVVGGAAGQAFGLPGVIVGTLGSLIVGKAFGSGSATAHIIGYHVEGSKKERHIAVGSSVKGIKPGDKIRITRGSFLSKVEVL